MSAARFSPTRRYNKLTDSILISERVQHFQQSAKALQTADIILAAPLPFSLLLSSTNIMSTWLLSVLYTAYYLQMKHLTARSYHYQMYQQNLAEMLAIFQWFCNQRVATHDENFMNVTRAIAPFVETDFLLHHLNKMALSTPLREILAATPHNIQFVKIEEKRNYFFQTHETQLMIGQPIKSAKKGFFHQSLAECKQYLYAPISRAPISSVNNTFNQIIDTAKRYFHLS